MPTTELVLPSHTPNGGRTLYNSRARGAINLHELILFASGLDENDKNQAAQAEALMNDLQQSTSNFDCGPALFQASQLYEDVYVPRGTYPVHSLGVNGVRPVSSAFRLHGAGEEGTRFVGTPTQGLLWLDGGASLKDLTLAGFGNAFIEAPSADVQRIAIENVVFEDCGRGPTWLVTTEQLHAGEVYRLHDLYMVNVRFKNMRGPATIFQCEVGGGTIHRYRVDGATQRGLQIGRNYARVTETVPPPPVNTQDEIFAGQHAHHDLSISDVRIENMRNTGFGTLDTVDETMHQVIVYGERHHLIDIHVLNGRSDARTKEIGGVYWKSLYNTVANSWVVDCWHVPGEDRTGPYTPTGTAFYFNNKGSRRGPLPISIQGYGSQLDNLHALGGGQGRSIGFRFQNGDIQASNLWTENNSVYGMYISSGAADPTDPDAELDSSGSSDIALHNFHCYGPDYVPGTEFVGINSTTGGTNVDLCDAQIRNVDVGIKMTAVQGSPRQHRVIRPSIRDVRGGRAIEVSYQVPIDGFELIGAVVDGVTPPAGTAFGIIFNGIAQMRNTKVEGGLLRRIISQDATATGLYLGCAVPMINVGVRKVAMDEVNSIAPGAAGYGVRTSQAPIENLELELGMMSQIKTRNVEYSTPPSSRSGMVEAFLSANPDSVPANSVLGTVSGVQIKVPVPGVLKAVGGFVSVFFLESSPTTDVSGISYGGNISDDGLVAVFIRNATAAPINLGNGTFHVRVDLRRG